MNSNPLAVPVAIATLVLSMNVKGAPGATGATESVGPTPTAASSLGPQIVRLGEPGLYEVRSYRVVSPNTESPARTLDRLGTEACAKAAEIDGVTINAGLVSFQSSSGQSLVERLTSSRASAFVLERTILESVRTDLPDATGYTTTGRVRCRILSKGRTPDANFQVHITLPSKTIREGDTVSITISTTRRARVFLVSVDDGGATVLLPNKYVSDAIVSPDHPETFPEEELLKRGVRIKASVARQGQPSHEYLLAVALKDDVRLDSVFGMAQGQVFAEADTVGVPKLVADLLQPLAGLPDGAVTFDQFIYEVLP